MNIIQIRFRLIVPYNQNFLEEIKDGLLKIRDFLDLNPYKNLLFKFIDSNNSKNNHRCSLKVFSIGSFCNICYANGYQ